MVCLVHNARLSHTFSSPETMMLSDLAIISILVENHFGSCHFKHLKQEYIPISNWVFFAGLLTRIESQHCHHVSEDGVAQVDQVNVLKVYIDVRTRFPDKCEESTRFIFNLCSSHQTQGHNRLVFGWFPSQELESNLVLNKHAPGNRCLGAEPETSAGWSGPIDPTQEPLHAKNFWRISHLFRALNLGAEHCSNQLKATKRVHQFLLALLCAMYQQKTAFCDTGSQNITWPELTWLSYL